MNQRDLIRLTLLFIVLGINAILTHYAFDKARGSPLLNCITVAAYSVLAIAAFLIAQACLCGRRDQTQKHPRLSLETVVIYVYGLGLIIFVTIYSVMAVSGDASSAYYTQLTAIAAEDTFVRTRDATLRRSLLFFCALLASASLICSSFNTGGMGETIQAIFDQQWFLIIYGLIMPITIPWVFFSVRGKRFYNPVTIYDFLYFGMPFASIMAATALAGLNLVPHPPNSVPPFFNATNETDSERLVTAADVATPLLCLNMLPTVFLAVQSILLYSTVDFMTVAALVTSLKAIAERRHSPLMVAAFVCSALAFTARVYACYRDEDDKCSVAYSRETEEDEDEDQMLEKIRQDVQMEPA